MGRQLKAEIGQCSTPIQKLPQSLRSSTFPMRVIPRFLYLWRFFEELGSAV